MTWLGNRQPYLLGFPSPWLLLGSSPAWLGLVPVLVPDLVLVPGLGLVLVAGIGLVLMAGFGLVNVAGLGLVLVAGLYLN